MIDAISPIDGRYGGKTARLADYFSERAFMRFRALVEVEYLIVLLQSGIVKNASALTENDIVMLRGISAIEGDAAARIKEIEKTTNHDVKAVEYYLKEKLVGTSLESAREWIHFALTSEDVNNMSYAGMLSLSLKNVIIPAFESLLAEMNERANTYANLSMLSRTHGQSASPTTLGHEFKVFAMRLSRQVEMLRAWQPTVKFAGATGNWNAHVVAFPDTDWIDFSEKFVASFNATYGTSCVLNHFTTQIEPHDTYAELFDTLRRASTIIIDFDQDMWRYISDGWLVQKPKEGEVGSSAMPHKVNPIDFENSEGNLGLANALAGFFSTKLPVSRLQRDLSDSTVERSFGTAFSHVLLGIESARAGLSKIMPSEETISTALASHPEVLAEAIQTVLRREGVEAPYEKLKELTRGKQVTLDDLRAFVGGLEVSDSVKSELLELTPEKYIGLASKLASL